MTVERILGAPEEKIPKGGGGEGKIISG